MNIIETKQLRYAYEDGTVALDGLDFWAEQGKITCILGANGAGKSTLFLNLNGILTPSGGEVWFAGKKRTYTHQEMQTIRKQVGIVFQDPDHQLFSADVYRDISFGAVNLGLPEEEVRRRVALAMEQTGTTDLQNKPTHALSFGQKKRVAIAGVLVMQPDVIILDEPTAGLDPKGVSDIMKLCQMMRQELGITIVLSTHDIDIVPLYCDHVFVFAKGKTITSGSPKEIFAHPEILRPHHIRLPRVAHLMEILHKKDGLAVDQTACTIGEVRREVKKLLEH